MSQGGTNLPSKILIVDDDPAVAQGLDEPLAKYSVKVDKAAREYVHYVRGMHNKYPVEVFEHNLAKLDPADAATAN